MDALVIQGGTRLMGEVSVSGSKNAALPIMASALLASGRTTLKRVPDLVDVRTLSRLLMSLGCDVVRDDDGSLSIEVIEEKSCEAVYDLVRMMRASVCVMGPLLAKRRSAIVSLPGGCHIGHRPIDLHLKGLSALGAEIKIVNGYVEARAKKLTGADIDLCGPFGSTVTGTCNVMSAAVLARGRTIITSAAREPEVIALAEFLNKMGAQVAGHGSSVIEIQGVDALQAASETIIPDRIEAATLMIASTISRGDLTIHDSSPEHLTTVLEALHEIGVEIRHLGNSSIQISCGESLSPGQITASVYPGVPTDVQAQLMALLACIPGRSSIRDNIFPDRFMHCAELNRMGARIQQKGNQALIEGVHKLQGAPVMASDLRASAALVLAAIAAQGESVIRRIYHLDRGYEALETKLNSLGARIVRCREQDLDRKAA